MHIFFIPFSYWLDSRSPDSSSVSSPPSGQRSPPLVPSAAASMTSLPPITTTGVNSPISSIGSPFSVISSSLGSPCLPGTPSVGYGPISSPQVRRRVLGFFTDNVARSSWPVRCLSVETVWLPLNQSSRLAKFTCQRLKLVNCFC